MVRRSQYGGLITAARPLFPLQSGGHREGQEQPEFERGKWIIIFLHN